MPIYHIVIFISIFQPNKWTGTGLQTNFVLTQRANLFIIKTRKSKRVNFTNCIFLGGQFFYISALPVLLQVYPCVGQGGLEVLKGLVEADAEALGGWQHGKIGHLYVVGQLLEVHPVLHLVHVVYAVMKEVIQERCRKRRQQINNMHYLKSVYYFNRLSLLEFSGFDTPLFFCYGLNKI